MFFNKVITKLAVLNSLDVTALATKIDLVLDLLKDRIMERKRSNGQIGSWKKNEVAGFLVFSE